MSHQSIEPGHALTPAEVQATLRKLHHAEDMASRAADAAARAELRRLIREGYLAIKPYLTGRQAYASSGMVT